MNIRDCMKRNEAPNLVTAVAADEGGETSTSEN